LLCSLILNESYNQCELNIEYKTRRKIAQKQNIEIDDDFIEMEGIIIKYLKYPHTKRLMKLINKS